MFTTQPCYHTTYQGRLCQNPHYYNVMINRDTYGYQLQPGYYLIKDVTFYDDYLHYLESTLWAWGLDEKCKSAIKEEIPNYAPNTHKYDNTGHLLVKVIGDTFKHIASFNEGMNPTMNFNAMRHFFDKTTRLVEDNWLKPILQDVHRYFTIGPSAAIDFKPTVNTFENELEAAAANAAHSWAFEYCRDKIRKHEAYVARLK